MANSYLQVINVTKSFGDLELYNDMSFGIMKGQKVALIAKNGTGKTTLLNIIAGEEDHESGEIVFQNDLSVAYLKQEPDFDESMTVLEACFNSGNEVLKTISRYEMCMQRQEIGLSEEPGESMEKILNLMDYHKAWNYEAEIKQILSKLKINDFTDKISTLSGGQKKRVALANALITEPDMLILDEPTNHLDLEMIEWLENYLTRSNLTLLMVTHDRYFLDRVCNIILELDNKTVYSYNGNYSYYLEKHQERMDQFNAELSKANNLYRRELDWMRRQPQARGTKAQYRIDAFGELEEKVSQNRTDNAIKLKVKSAYLGSKIFVAKYISKSYGNKILIKDFYYDFARYEKVGIVGKNGTGKSTFLKMLLGEVNPDSGTFDIGETVTFGYYSQQGLTYDENIKVIDVIRNIAEEIDLGNGKKLSASQFLQHFLFTPETQHSYVYKLSGGEKRRLYLCSVLMKNPNFLVLDEPTNDLDILSLNILEDYLKEFKGCVLVVSHDRYFMDKIVDHLFVFKGDGVIKDFPGNYTQYRALEDKEESEDKKSASQTDDMVSKKQQWKEENAKSRKRKLSYNEKRELEQLEKDLESLNEGKSTIESDLSGGLTDSKKIEEYAKRLSEINNSIDEKEMRWLELSEIEGE